MEQLPYNTFNIKFQTRTMMIKILLYPMNPKNTNKILISIVKQEDDNLTV